MRHPIPKAAAALAALCFATSASAAAWNVPTNVRIVQKSNTDASGRIYSTIQAALASIPTSGASAPSAANPYVVKVMPGVYDLAGAALAMRSFVDVEGSGRENTVITSTNSNADTSVCQVGTVVMAADSAIRDLEIVQQAPALGGAQTPSAALVFDNVKARAERVTVVTGDDEVAGARNIGVCTHGDFADARLDGVDVQSHNRMGQSNALMTFGGRIDVRGSRLTSTHGPDSGNSRAVNDDSATPATITIANSELQSSGPAVNALFVGASTLELSGSSVVIGATGAYNSLLWSTGSVTITNTRIRNNAQPFTAFEFDPALVRIAASELPSDVVPALAGARIVQSWDQGFTPIADQ